MQPAQAFSPNATTFLTHIVGLGLADKRYVVQRFKSMLDGDIRPVEAEAPKGSRRRKAKHVLATLKEVDVSGPNGFMDFLEAVLDPAREQHRDMVRWYGGPFDPIGVDEERARFGMENMVCRRRGPLASHRSGSRRRKR